ncbi:MAG: Na-translocating system protein MpsC family protein [bacterium]
MSRFKTEMEANISRAFNNFQKEQLGEHAASVTTYLSSNMFTVRADNCLAPGEQNLVQNEKHWQLLQEVKTRQFEKVRPLLKERLEELIGCKILSIYSIVSQDGVRFAVFTLSESLENELSKTKETLP